LELTKERIIPSCCDKQERIKLKWHLWTPYYMYAPNECCTQSWGVHTHTTSLSTVCIGHTYVLPIQSPNTHTSIGWVTLSLFHTLSLPT
jgi:hypothetical protein